MAIKTFDQLKADLLTYLINATEIPAEKLNELLQDTIDTIEFNIDDFSEFFKGLANTGDDPGTPAHAVMYQANGAGTYTNFGGLVVAENFAFLVYNGSAWELTETDITIDMSDYAKKTMDDDLDANSHRIIGLSPDFTAGNDAISVGGSLFSNHPFNEVTRHLDQVTIAQAIKDIKLFGADKDTKYALRRISRNLSGTYNMQIKELSGTAIVAYLSDGGYTPSANVEWVDVPEHSGSGITAKVLIDWSKLADNWNWQDTANGIEFSAKCVEDTDDNRLASVETDLSDAEADIIVLEENQQDLVNRSEWKDDYHKAATEPDLTCAAVLDVRILNAEVGYAYAICRYYNALTPRGDQILVLKKNISTGANSWVVDLKTEEPDYHRKNEFSNNIEDVTPIFFESDDGTKIFVLMDYSLIPIASVNGLYNADADLTERQFINESKYTYREADGEVTIQALSKKVLCKMTGDYLRVISKWNSEKDIVIDFKDTPYNELVTFNGVYLRDNTDPEPERYELDTGMTLLNSASSDNVGPYSCKATGSSFNEWVGGAHLSQDDEPENTTWEVISSLDDVAKTITLVDASAFPTPNSGEVHLIYIKEWNGSTYESQGRYSYTGKSGNTLSGVELYYYGDLSGVTGIGDPNPTQAVFVLKTAEIDINKYYLDGIEITDEFWREGHVLNFIVKNILYDPHTKRSNPNTPANWDTLFEEHLTYQIVWGGTIDIANYTKVKKLVDIVTYYGLQSIGLVWPEFMYFPEAIDSTKQTYAVGGASGAINSYPNCDKMVAIDETNNVIQEIMIDLDYGNPANYATLISNPAVSSRVGNPAKHYFYQITSQTSIPVDTILSWHGLHNYAYNLQSNTDILVYKRHFKGNDYIIIDLMDDLTFPYTYECRIPELVNREVEIEYKTTGITIADESSGAVVAGANGLIISASNTGQIIIKL